MIKVKDLEEEFAEEFVDAGLLVLPKRKKIKVVTTEVTCCHSHLACFLCSCDVCVMRWTCLFGCQVEGDVPEAVVTKRAQLRKERGEKPSGLPHSGILKLLIPSKMAPLAAEDVYEIRQFVQNQWSAAVLAQRCKKARGGEHTSKLVGLVPVYADCTLSVGYKRH